LPTIIDALVVELSLDPSKFTEGQRRVGETLRQMHQRVAEAQRRADVSALERSRTLSNGFSGAFSGANQQLTNLSAQSRRAGASVAAGAEAGAAGFTALTSKILAAYTALKSVEGLMKSVAQTSATGANLGRIAPEIGAPTQWVAAFANAAKVAVNANPETVKEDLRSLSVDLETLRVRGEMSGRLKEMMIGGVDVRQGDTIEQLLGKLEANLASKTPQEAAMRAERYGLGRETGRFLRTGPAAVNAAVTTQMSVSTTDAQAVAYTRLQAAINSVEIAYGSMVDKLIERNRGLAAAIESFDKWLRDLQSTPEGLKSVEKALDALAAAVSVMLATMVARFVAANAVIVRTPLGALLLGAVLAYEATGGTSLPLGPVPAPMGGGEGSIGGGFVRRAWNWLTGKPKEATAPQPAPSSPGGAGPGTRDILRDHGAGTGTPAPTGGKNDVTEEKLRSFGIDPATAAALNYISHSETPQGSVMNSVGASRGVSPTQAFGYTAQGYWQMLNSNWRKYAGQLGFYPQYQNALAAPLEVQAKVAALMYKTEGPTPWMSAAGGSINAGRLRGIHAAQARATSGASSFSIIPSAEAAMPPAISSAASVAGQLVTIRAAQATATGGVGATTHNYGDVSVNVGDIHTQATDAAGVARDLGTEIRRSTLVNQANTGLE
jgi:hypothetical protein